MILLISIDFAVLHKTAFFTIVKGGMGDLKDRVKEVRLKLGISQRDFAKSVFISQTLLGDIELGNRNVNDRTIQLISTQFKVNKEWLLTGKGRMFDSQPPDIQLEKLIDIFKQLDKPLRNFLLLQSKELLKMQKKRLDSGD